MNTITININKDITTIFIDILINYCIYLFAVT